MARQKDSVARSLSKQAAVTISGTTFGPDSKENTRTVAGIIENTFKGTMEPMDRKRILKLPEELPILKSAKVTDNTGNPEKAKKDSEAFRQKCLEMINSGNDLAIIEIPPDKNPHAEYALDKIEGVVRLIQGMKCGIRNLIKLLERNGIEYKES